METQYAQLLIGVLEDAQDVGLNYVSYKSHDSVDQLNPKHIYFFENMGQAINYALSENKSWQQKGPGIAYPVRYMSIEQMLSELRKANPLTINKIDMNRNNLENIQEEMKGLGFSKKAIEDAQQKMEKGLPEFNVNDKVIGTKGQVDVTGSFRQSGQSDNYYFNKFVVALNTGKPLEEGHKYFVISPNEKEPGKNLSKSFENVSEAISFFKEQKGDSRLAAGKDAGHTTELATMKAGKVDYVEKDFQRTYRTPAQTQTFFVERGKGFTVEQAANMIQGRAVFRDDLLNLAGQPYAAWVKLDFDSPKDRYQNYTTNQYHVPTYGFTIKEALSQYQIKEMDDPKKAENLVKAFENGNRILATTVKDGQEIKLHVEAAPRYRQINFFQENGKPEKREQFLKEPKLENALQINKGKGQDKNQEQGMAV